jgi:hypothetical protein
MTIGISTNFGWQNDFSWKQTTILKQIPRVLYIKRYITLNRLFFIASIENFLCLKDFIVEKRSPMPGNPLQNS